MISSASFGIPFFGGDDKPKRRAGKEYPPEARGGVILGGDEDDISTPQGAQAAVNRAVARANQRGGGR